MRGGESVALTVVVEGPADPPRFEKLAERMGGITVVAVPEGTTATPGALNAVIDEAKAQWILLVKAREQVGHALAAEIAGSATVDPHAWGFRIASQGIYCGAPLSLGRTDPGDVRLFHRRRARLQQDGRMKVQGTVVRLVASFDLILHESEERHIEALRASGRREVGIVRRLTGWATAVMRHGPASLSLPTRRYLWIEAGWDPDR